MVLKLVSRVKDKSTEVELGKYGRSGPVIEEEE